MIYYNAQMTDNHYWRQYN